METLTLKQVIDKALKYSQSNINTALPCKVIEFDKDTQLAKVQILIERVKTEGDEVEGVAIPEIEGVPVVQPFSGKIAITMPIEKDDTGLLVFNQRNIDTFVVEGTQAMPHDNRMHDYQDCVLIMGFTHQKRVISDYDDDGMAIRSEDNVTHIQLKQDGTININSGSTTVEIKKDGDVTINTGKIALTGDLEMTGNLKVTGNIVATGSVSSTTLTTTGAITGASVVVAGDVTAGTTSLKTHTHLSGGTLIGYSGFVITGVTGKPTA